MPTFEYRNSKGERVPGVTTALKMYGDGTDGLVWWAWDLGKQGKDLREEREKVCDAGTLAHSLAEADIKGKPLPSLDGIDEGMRAKVLAAFEAYKLWKASTRLEVVASEIPLVSEAHGYGGCIDAIVVFDGAAGILDFKSAKRLYKKTVAQVAAYARLWTEAHPDLPIKHRHVLRWDDTGGFHHHALSDDWDSAGWLIFHHSLELYRLSKLIRA
jgi:hypothetical protein